MTTSRRSFVKTLLGLATLPFAARALGKTPPADPTFCGFPVDFVYDTAAADRIRAYEVQGIGIKVPSNRFVVDTGLSYEPRCAYYEGEWDGTLKVEQGCSNPAFVLAHLLEQNGTGTDAWHRGSQLVMWSMDWKAIYDYGRHCDELVVDIETEHLNPRWMGGAEQTHYWAPRFEVNTVVKTAAEGAKLREELRMHFLSWRAEDPRYRRSIPIPYQGVKRSVFSTLA